MNNRAVIGVLGIVAALAIVFGIVQSQNLSQSQTKLADAQTAAVKTLSAADVEAGEMLTAAAQAAASQQIEMVATQGAQASATLGAVIADAATTQAKAQSDAATGQAQAAATQGAQASATLGAVMADAATTQAKAATAQASAVKAIQNAAATRLANTVSDIAATVTARQEGFEGTRTALEGQIEDLQTRMSPTSLPTATAVITQAAKGQTPQQLCAAAKPVHDPETRRFSAAKPVLQAGVDYFAIVCTDAGAIYIDLFEKKTPLTVNNFVFLAQQGFYNNTTFHRVLENFMAQGGDPTGSGTGGPGYQFNDEIVPELNFGAPGRLAMANSGPNTNGSQFFITFTPQNRLDGGYTIFGQVVEGQANVRKIKLRDPDQNPTFTGTTLDTVLIVTDPAKVVLSDNPLPKQAEVEKALDGVNALITSDIETILEHNKLSQTTEELISSAPEAAREDLKSLLTANHHQYRVSSTLNNKACDVSQIQFYSATYILDAFTTAKDARAAIGDPLIEKIAMESGYTDKVTPDTLTHPYFTVKKTVCDQPVIDAMTYWQRGNFLITVQIIWPADSQQGLDVLDRVLSEFVGARLYEPLLVDILYSDIQ